jgi:hypothetical protein
MSRVSILGVELVGKRLELLGPAVPEIIRVERTETEVFKEVDVAARALHRDRPSTPPPT